MNNLEFQMDEIGNGVHDLPDQEALRLENQQLRGEKPFLILN